jgi:hypothetical protein
MIPINVSLNKSAERAVIAVSATVIIVAMTKLLRSFTSK